MKTVILAGGTGTRLWPLSRKQFPKQFIMLHDSSLFQKAFQSALRLSPPEKILVVTSADHRYLVVNQLEEIGSTLPTNHLLLEPSGRNTLPAISWAMKVIADETRRGDKGTGDDACETVAVLPSDHLLGREAPGIIASAEALATDYIVTFGVRPTRPHTGYGYIHPGEARGPGYMVSAFEEKPDAQTAQSHIDAGCLWNSGILLTTPERFFSELSKWNPSMYRAFSEREPDYLSIESISIDHGLLERSDRVAVIPLDTPWSDLGTFEALYDTEAHDASGNAGDAVTIDSTGSYFVHPEGKKIAAIGIHHLLVVDTPDALLLCDRSQAEMVKDLVAIFEAEKDPVIDLHTLVQRPWGSYLILEDRPFFKIKRITVKPGKQISLQMHHHRSEHWIVVSGTAEVSLNGETRLIHQGESTYVKAGVRHKLRNPGRIPLEIIEVSIGEYISEDDIVRFEDEYGRS